ncbi:MULTISPECIES: hypothetical protein [Halocynthiibacter]|uniref:Uncharacterized protein n=1 Tax=Halocynthiibacter halioticoli TaxID=2986804 RepID=A0AAE3LUF0_9RHOB|nr:MULTISPECIES: hypothetical protein [Halocynthiibacter]MCV6823950.1 hypothetical protein [Halocynthiibacter halioticoli]MCW4056951.1 hypothetical protein [Halocynthiibacter sp. SDUM655004]MDE0590031.1 hypothetical protein [Halocynthiibacter sp. C4]
MDWLIITGAVVSFLGLCGLVYCIVSAMKARKSNLDDEAMRVHLRGLVAWNMGALFTSILGLMIVVVGIMFG